MYSEEQIAALACPLALALFIYMLFTVDSCLGVQSRQVWHLSDPGLAFIVVLSTIDLRAMVSKWQQCDASTKPSSGALG
jgi:hypothetical protein